MKIRIDKADQVFSQYIRLRDMRCMRCYSPVELNEKGLPISHQNSHYFSRSKESTRFEPTNCDTLCFRCHQIWGGDARDEYMGFKIAQLGIEGFNRLKNLSMMLVKKDRKMSYLYAKSLFDELKSK